MQFHRSDDDPPREDSSRCEAPSIMLRRTSSRAIAPSSLECAIDWNIGQVFKAESTRVGHSRVPSAEPEGALSERKERLVRATASGNPE